MGDLTAEIAECFRAVQGDPVDDGAIQKKSDDAEETQKDEKEEFEAAAFPICGGTDGLDLRRGVFFCRADHSQVLAEKPPTATHDC